MLLDPKQFKEVVKMALVAALDRVESGLPDCIDWADRLAHRTTVDPKPLALQGYERGAMETAGMFLACFQLQYTKDGMGIGDALVVAGNFDDAVEQFVINCWKNEGKDFKAAQAKLMGTGNSYDTRALYRQFGYPDVAKHAAAFCKVVIDGEPVPERAGK
jgi:hypothetical protein